VGLLVKIIKVIRIQEVIMPFRKFLNVFCALVIIGLSISVPSQVWASETNESNPLELRKIMQGMGKSMQLIVDGISREDWESVASVAPLIADHPQPSMGEKIRILSFIGSDVSKFKGHDQKTHQAALALEQAAIRHDGQAVILNFATLQNSCLSCHQQFRKSFVNHFYE
jgi:cytochrome c556